MSEHTPVPWEGFPPQDPTMIKTIIGYPGMDDSERSPIIALGKGAKRKANAEFIVLACNAHDQMLEALKVQASWTMRDGTPCACPAGKNEEEPKGRMPIMHSTSCQMLRAAIAKTEGNDR